LIAGNADNEPRPQGAVSDFFRSPVSMRVDVKDFRYRNDRDSLPVAPLTMIKLVGISYRAPTVREGTAL
jgi:hypothetical protein